MKNTKPNKKRRSNTRKFKREEKEFRKILQNEKYRQL